ncbi:MAG: DNA integrity scanning diadenylate cyclase DisA [Thermaerobacter sp.]|nr:DNA integrity scanning diadenylate cyclase DisA [Thermaerobacter sp.]
MRDETERLHQILRRVAPGTPLREGLENVLHAGTGGLIVLGDSPEVLGLAAGGFRIDCPFLASAVYELAKMDGAIILSADGDRILHANVQLVPDARLPSLETGIRHRTAERVSRQTGCLVVAISQRRRQITLYKGALRHVLRDASVVLGRANQALQTLERQRLALRSEIEELGALEFTGDVTLDDVVAIIQRAALADRIAAEVAGYIEELGSEGRLVAMQLQELMRGLPEEILYVLRDYAAKSDIAYAREIRDQLAEWSADAILDLSAIARLLGHPGELEQVVQPRGLRVLRHVPRLPPPVAEHLAERFGTLLRLLSASIEELDDVEGIGATRARSIQAHLQRMRELSR